jgi:hypothetical protein
VPLPPMLAELVPLPPMLAELVPLPPMLAELVPLPPMLAELVPLPPMLGPAHADTAASAKIEAAASVNDVLVISSVPCT